MIKTLKKFLRVYKRFSRKSMILLFDSLLALASVPIALMLRVGKDIVLYPTISIILYTGVFTLVACGWYLISQSYIRMWRTLSFRDLIAYNKLCFLIFLTYVPMFFILHQVYTMPRSLTILVFFVQLFSLLSVRYIYYTWCIFKNTTDFPQLRAKESSLVLGNGKWLEEILYKQQAPQLQSFTIKGILHRDKKLTGRLMYGIPILGSYDDLKTILKKNAKRKKSFRSILVADVDTLTSKDFKMLLEIAAEYDISLQKLLPRNELDDTIAVERISVEDLLGRDEVSLDLNLVGDYFSKKTVLITGAGGSIGSELVRQIFQLKPNRVILLDNSEYHLYNIDMEVTENYPQIESIPILADVTQKERIQDIFKKYKPDVVFHAAALKHVPMVEVNPMEGVRVNVKGTYIVANACIEHGIKTMVMISTDKAINPTNIMGASKRLAETYCQSLDALGGDHQSTTRFVTVRFGNVLGSTGSVVPLFQSQIKKGGPITLTHPEMIRYFMTIQEAVSLVLQATALEQEHLSSQGSIFVLDMGEPVRISDLARQMVLLAGKVPGKDIEFHYKGIRPGEKLYEELFHEGEKMEGTSCPKLFRAYPRFSDYSFLKKHLDKLFDACGKQDLKETAKILTALVPEYKSK